MSIRADFDKVLVARAKIESARTLPDRLWANCCYCDECRYFVETHLLTVKALLDRAAVIEGGRE